MATFTPNEIALRFTTDAKTLRRFLRADARERGLRTPGKGSRWLIEGRDLNRLRGAFGRWAKAQDEARAARQEAAEAARDAAFEAAAQDSEPSDAELADDDAAQDSADAEANDEQNRADARDADLFEGVEGPADRV